MLISLGDSLADAAIIDCKAILSSFEPPATDDGFAKMLDRDRGGSAWCTVNSICSLDRPALPY